MLFLIRLMLARTLFHPLEGLTWRRLHAVLRAERYRISLRYWPKVALLGLQSLWQSGFERRVAAKYRTRIEAAPIAAPVFILGHYRSGTTHLHELMSIDPQFASPTRFQAYQAPSFLATEGWFARWNDLFMLPRRVQEDEIGLMNLTAMSPYMDWCFPDSAVDYSRFLTFRRDGEAAEAWQAALRWYLGALTIRYQKPILLKSPPHTARIRSILQVFPDAKFVHIRRNPFDVYVSTIRLLRDLDPVFRLRVRRQPDQGEYVLKTYREMYDAFFEDLPLIPPGQFVEVAYEELDRDPVAQLRLIYRDLHLGGFPQVEPLWDGYLKSIAGYQKNRHPKIDPLTRQRIAERWANCFARWGYPIEPAGSR